MTASDPIVLLVFVALSVAAILVLRNRIKNGPPTGIRYTVFWFSCLIAVLLLLAAFQHQAPGWMLLHAGTDHTPGMAPAVT
ncbi:MAG: hypothetical protein QM747_12835 [Nocardioides sp.]